jgi:hypothetical protein
LVAGFQDADGEPGNGRGDVEDIGSVVAGPSPDPDHVGLGRTGPANHQQPGQGGHESGLVQPATDQGWAFAAAPLGHPTEAGWDWPLIGVESAWPAGPDQ